MNQKDERKEDELPVEGGEQQQSAAADGLREQDDVLILEDTGEDSSDVELLEELTRRPVADGGDGGEKVRDLENRLEEMRERHLRALADYENLKKRTAREKLENAQRVTAGLLNELLPVLDNFEAALAAPPESVGSDDFRSGVELIARQMRDMLSRLDVSEVPGEGSPFDPSHHEAMTREEREDVESATVIGVLRRGYRLKERLLRPAMVRVAVPAETPVAESEPDEASAEETADDA